ncbi:MAG: prenyltransferase/squalene oxidase repeat-containing protein [Candidatus Bathyarchaeia archaeon]
MKPLLALQGSMKGLIDVDAIVGYILERQNADGGYTFCRWTESNAQDTFYALNILDILGVQPINVDKTINFLKSLQHVDGRFDSIKVAYYVIKSILKFGERLLKPPKDLTEYLPILVRSLESPFINVETLSEVESIYMLVDLCTSLNIKVDSKRIIEAILRIKNADGSFGSAKRSRMASTFYAIEILKILNYNINGLTDTLKWIRLHERSEGGFTHAPETAPTYLEDTYFGIKSLEAMNERIAYPRETLTFVAGFQNPNGGFRRSIFLGISDFESTYQALSSIRVLLSPLGLGWF